MLRAGSWPSVSWRIAALASSLFLSLARPIASPGGRARAWGRATVDDLFGLDLRALAVMRISLGLIMLRDLWVRSYDLVAFYSDRGALPREAILERLDATWRFSLHMMNGEWQFNAVLFLIHAAFAVMFTIGFRTRLANLLCWVFVISLHARGSIQLRLLRRARRRTR